jgi:hypothetical protein
MAEWRYVYSSTILDLGIRWRRVVKLHAPAALPSKKEPRVPIGEEARWAPQPVWTLWGREKSYTVGNRTRAI